MSRSASPPRSPEGGAAWGPSPSESPLASRWPPGGPGGSTITAQSRGQVPLTQTPVVKAEALRPPPPSQPVGDTGPHSLLVILVLILPPLHHRQVESGLPRGTPWPPTPEMPVTSPQSPAPRRPAPHPRGPSWVHQWQDVNQKRICPLCRHETLFWRQVVREAYISPQLPRPQGTQAGKERAHATQMGPGPRHWVPAGFPRFRHGRDVVSPRAAPHTLPPGP